MSKNNRTISARQSEDKTLFEALIETAKNEGSPAHEMLYKISKERLISPATLLGTSSFYDFLRKENRGKKAYLCNGTSCMLSGKQKDSQALLLKHFSTDEIGNVACVGHCYHGASYWQGDQTYDAKHGLENTSAPPPIPYTNNATDTLFSDDFANINDFYSTLLRDPKKIISELSDSKLRGRGGAGFPFAEKLRSCLKATAEKKYIVCNGDEGDPGAFSDRYLMEHQPQRVLGGMLAAAHVLGAKNGYLYIRAEYPLAQQRMHDAIVAFEKTDAARQCHFKFHIIRGAGAYICGEETALLNSIEGLRPEVRTRPPYPAEAGLFGYPTLLSNVETFALIPWILQHSGNRFSEIGTEESTGTKLLSFDHSFNNPGIHEVTLGTPLQQAINEYGGGFHSAVKAIQIGGPLGSIIPINKITSLSLDYESFAEQGFELGHAGFIGIPESYPMIDFLRHLFTYMANESCGKCVPCRVGTEKGRILLTTASHDKQLNLDTFSDLLETLEIGSLCGLGSGLPLPVRNILYYFSDELSDYIDQGGNHETSPQRPY